MDAMLVTGAGGFLGRHLCSEFRKTYRVLGAGFPGVEPVTGIEWKRVNDAEGLAQLVLDMRPDLVVHAAFVNRKPPDITDQQYLNNMLAVNVPLFKAVATISGKLIITGSSAVYGNTDAKRPIEESYPFSPVSLYGLSKVLQEESAQYYQRKGLKICIARLFNLIGPGQKWGMLLPDWVIQARAIADGKASEFRVRHRRTSRDFVDVRDAAAAIVLMASDFKPGEVFNVASGKLVWLQDIIDEIERLCPVPLRIVETEPFSSGTDVVAQRGSFEKIKSIYGWQPVIGWQRSLKDLWESYGS